MESRFSGGYEYDFKADDNESPDATRISNLYVDVGNRPTQTSGRLGRQTRSTGGVLGRFDGGLVSHQFLSWAKLNLVAGYPVASSKDGLQTDRYFYGLSADFGTFANAWDFVAFAIEQYNGDLLDRQAVGGEMRYFVPNRSLLALVDYDVFYDTLNTFLMLGNWTLPNKMTVNATLDVRKSPVLTTTNALIGQTTVQDLDGLQTLYTDAEIYQLAGDITATEISGTNTSGGVEGTPATDPSFYYNAQLIGSGLFMANDINIFGLRYSDAATADTLSATLNSRFPFGKSWRLNPRVRVDYRQNSSDDSTQQTLYTSLRTEYRWRKSTRFELEVSGDWTTQEFTTGSRKSVPTISWSWDTAWIFEGTVRRGLVYQDQGQKTPMRHRGHRGHRVKG